MGQGLGAGAMAPVPQHCWGYERSDPHLLCAGVCILTHPCRCLWGVCTRLCLQVFMAVDVPACICTCAQVVVVWVDAYACVHFGGAWLCVCVHTHAVGVHTWRSPRADRTQGYSVLGCACGGLSPTSCCSLAQKQPLLHEWGSVSSTPQHPLGPTGCTPSDAAPASVFSDWSTPGIWGMQGQVWGHSSRTSAPVTCVGPVAPLGLCQLILSGLGITIPAACLGVAFQGGAAPAWCQPRPAPS